MKAILKATLATLLVFGFIGGGFAGIVWTVQTYGPEAMLYIVGALILLIFVAGVFMTFYDEFKN